MQNLSRFFVVAALGALGACAAQNSAAVHHGTGSGSGSDDDSGDMDAGVGSDGGSGSGSGSAIVPPGTLYGSVLDERNDAIDFSTGEPVHTHQGAAIDLSQGCPAVYKYAYLEDAADPMFGSQSNANPLQWLVKSQVGSLDDSATAYRVRLDDGTVALDWTSAQAPDDTGLYTVRLYRNGTPSVTQVGDHTGKMYLDMRFRDTQGNETVDTACWENHPLAAPLEIQAAAQSDLFGWTLPAHSAISTAINTASIDGSAAEQVGASIDTQTILQHTAEPVTLHIDHDTILANASNEVVQMNIVTTQRTVTEDCIGIDQDECNAWPAAPGPTTFDGALTATFDIRVVDSASGAIVCHNPDGSASWVQAIDGCVLPARTSTEPPHAYTLIYSINNATSIAPLPGSAAHEATVRNYLEQPFTGTLSAVGDQTGCAEVSGDQCLKPDVGGLDYFLDKAHIDFDAFSLIVQTAPDANASLEAIGSYATPSLSVAAASWDAGDAGFAD